MEGIPDADLKVWKAQRAEKLGLTPTEPKAKRPRIAQVPLTDEQAKAQLAAHKALMSGTPLVVPAVPAPTMPGFGGIPPPPPGFIGMPGQGMPFPPPPGGFSLPPG